MLHLKLLPGAISEMMASVTETGCVTLADRYGLLAAVLDDTLDDEDRRSANRLLRSIVRGRVKVCNEHRAA
ncbi:MAG: hypothetical protein J7641_01145 [Cyanobacteria bacterium SID2]|nr:hypothetical protein [Cyanobacteria bacterium SID2]MBP0004754.1 hypothetical protein [Cyanobacteria bacterium SBC]